MQHIFLPMLMLFFLNASASSMFVRSINVKLKHNKQAGEVQSVLRSVTLPPASISFLNDSAFNKNKYDELMRKSRIYKTTGIPLIASGGAVFFTGVGIMYYVAFTEDLAENKHDLFTGLGLGLIAGSTALLVPGAVLTAKGVSFKKRAKRIQSTFAFKPNFAFYNQSNFALGASVRIGF